MQFNAELEARLANLKTFDYVNLIIVVLLGLVTFPLAFVVYFRLLTARAFRGNYTFRLIVVAGLVDFLLYLANLVVLQCCNLPQLSGFYAMLNDRGLALPLMIAFQFLIFLQESLALSVALNRLLSIVKNTFLLSHARSVFFASLFFSLVASAIVVCLGRPHSFRYALFYTGEGSFGYSPENFDDKPYLLTMIFLILASAVALIASLLLAVSIFAYRRQFSIQHSVGLESGAMGQIDYSVTAAVSGLILIAVCHFVHSIITNVAKIIGTYYKVLAVAYSLSLFIAVGCVTPFWCMLLCAKSIRNDIFSKFRVQMSVISPVTPSSS